MRALVEKELRLLLPAFLAAVALAIVPMWDPMNPGTFAGWLCMFGPVLLALFSFGREIGLKTFPFILAQPLERSRIWWTKIALLAVCTAAVYGARWLSIWLTSTLWHVVVMPPKALAFFVVSVAAFMAGGLWMTLLLRQMVAAFWLAILIPEMVGFAIQAIGGSDWMIITILGLYAITAFFLARWQFLHLQDTAWTGGIVTFGRRRAVAAESALRERRPWRALFLKELKLHELTLAGIAGLFVLHLGVVALRKAGAHVFARNTLSVLEMFGVVWLFIPLLAGSQSVAEERQLGTLDGLLCLPVSRRVQFGVKLLFVLVLGALLSSALLCAVERIGSAVGAGSNLGVMGLTFKGADIIPVFFVFLTLSLFGFYASTLTRSVAQALAAGVVTTLVFWAIFRIAAGLADAFGLRLWPVMAFPTLTVAIIWVAYGNFRWMFESGRRWRRNIFGLTTVIVLISASAAAIYNRAWEWAMPLEGGHGPARLPGGKPVLFRSYGSALAAVLPDGRFWERFEYGHGATVSGGYFVPGSNWVDAVPLAKETVGIRSDGTLWVSEKPQWQDRLVQFGSETDWQSLARSSGSSVVLLKPDGTLWRWGTNTVKYNTYQGLRNSPPLRLGADSDWARIIRGTAWVYAWKRDGNAWVLHQPEPNQDWGDMRLPTFDRIQFQSFSSRQPEAALREDGTLWSHRNWWDPFWGTPRSPRSPKGEAAAPDIIQIGKGSKWEAVAGGSQLLVLKTDGSIWKWKLFRGHRGSHQEAPERLGTHDDWVGIGSWFNGSVALAADGTLWRWPATDAPPGWENDSDGWLAPSTRPAKIENILDARE